MRILILASKLLGRHYIRVEWYTIPRNTSSCTWLYSRTNPSRKYLNLYSKISYVKLPSISKIKSKWNSSWEMFHFNFDFDSRRDETRRIRIRIRRRKEKKRKDKTMLVKCKSFCLNICIRCWISLIVSIVFRWSSRR